MAQTALSQKDIDLIRVSYLHLSADLQRAGDVFYEALFEMAPETRPLFLQDMTAQAAKLMSTLGLVVSQLQNTEALEPVVRDLALRHLAYGVEAHHYDLVRAALIRMLRTLLDQDEAEDTFAAWARAYDRLAGVMLAAAYPEKPRTAARPPPEQRRQNPNPSPTFKNSRSYEMKTIRLSIALALALSATNVSAATLLTFDGIVTAEDYDPGPSPFPAAADSVTVSVIFDDTIPADATPVAGDLQIANYRTGALATTVDFFDAGGNLMTSADAYESRIRLVYNTVLGRSSLSLSSFFDTPDSSPFFVLDTIFFGNAMFDSAMLTEVTEGRLQFADLIANGKMEFEPDPFDILGMHFDVDLESLKITRDVAPPPSPVPAPPAILAMLTGLYGLRLVRRRSAEATPQERETPPANTGSWLSGAPPGRAIAAKFSKRRS